MQAYYINLERRTDRREFMEQQFSRLGLTAERIEAVTVDNLSASDLDIFCNPARGEWRTPSELACNRSHLKVLGRIAEGPDALALVLEDDAVLSASLPGFLARYSPREDILRIETALYPLRSAKIERRIEGIGIGRYYGGVAGAAGYIISSLAAKIVIASGWLPRLMSDQVLCNSYHVASMGLTVRQTDPGLCVQSYLLEGGTLGSDLADRTQRAATESPFKMERIPYLLREGFKRDVLVGVANIWHERAGGAKKRVIPFQPA